MREVRWASLDSDGIEHLTLSRDGDGYLAESVIIGRHDDGRRYRLACDGHWRTTRATLSVMGGATLSLLRDREGRWQDGEGRPLPALEGCVDLDIAATPYTNTLPIRRLGLRRDERRAIEVAYVSVPDLAVSRATQAYVSVPDLAVSRATQAYVSVPDLAVSRATQAYVCIEPGRRYRYEGIDGRFTAGLSVDDDGLVLEYDTLFRRLPAA
ncbi:putative glycolipid-binding domain-containing protein [Burkholderia gladioli]|uniref:putative glycolipid-binding domain-containing protein n=1 Tax=Burkholderia gladioli TaxID=28095 RepID=UPI001640A235|nr:putative glycolipid-binding domain-containing protein [Burkholderia gladioli]